jgi:hypothetical protein
MDRWTLLETCAAQSWNPGWGDADIFGVLLTFLYASATLMTAYATLQVWLYGSQRSSRWLWLLAMLYLILLTLNKQLDLQTFITQTGRCVARAEGWYAQRRGWQEVAAFTLIGVMGLAGLILTAKARRGNGMMILGLGLLTTFVALRILSFHHMDTLLKTPLFGLGLARIIELSSLLIINYAAATKTPSA